MGIPRPPECKTGDEALARGAWAEARAAFEQALSIHEFPEALEGLGIAAWWLDLGDLVFDSRERSYRLYLSRGDRAAAARVAVWLAWDSWAFRGEYAITNGWLQRARRLLENLPLGAEIAVPAGNPMQAVPYTIRLKFPAHYAIPAHSHSTDENVVVIAGALTFGMGEKLVNMTANNKTLAVGGFALMPAGMNHYAFTTNQPSTIVLYGQGPVEFKYVNPADDPRNARGMK